MLALSAVLLIFSLQRNHFLIFYVVQPGSTAAYWFISVIERCRKFGPISCTAQENNFEFILMVKWKLVTLKTDYLVVNFVRSVIIT